MHTFMNWVKSCRHLCEAFPLLGICSLVVGSFSVGARGTGSIPVVWTVSANRFTSDP